MRRFYGGIDLVGCRGGIRDVGDFIIIDGIFRVVDFVVLFYIRCIGCGSWRVVWIDSHDDDPIA